MRSEVVGRRIGHPTGAVLLLALMLVPGALAQSEAVITPDAAEGLPLSTLEEAGLQNLTRLPGAEGFAYAFEYRLARSPAAGVCRLLEAAAGLAPDEPLNILLLHAGIPTIALAVEPGTATADTQADAPNGCEAHRITSASFDVAPYAGRLPAAAANPPLLDVVVGTHYGFRWGAGWDIVELHAALAPRLQLRLWPGMEISTEVLLPVWNEWPGETGHVRPGVVTANKLIRLPHATFVRIAAGKFSAGRAGVDVQLRRSLWNGRLVAGLDAGHTAGVSFPQGSLLVDTAGRTVVLTNVGGYVPRYDLFVRVAGGRFLFGDFGAEASVFRSFGGLDVGFTATSTEHGSNAGFHVVLPLLRGRAVGHRRIRLRPEPYVSIRYEYSRDLLVGERYRTGMDLDEILHQHHPIFLPHRLHGN